jgi:hypothetical protein
MANLPNGAIVIDPTTLEAVAQRMHHDPHSVLGAHSTQGAITVRTLQPLARAVTVLAGSDRFPMIREHEGIWVAVLPLAEMPDYRLEVNYSAASIVDEPYRFLPTLGEVDLHLTGEGRHEQLWKVLGAHARHFAGPLGAVDGASFAVWPPTPGPSGSSAISTTGPDTPCAAWAPAVSGRSSSPASAPETHTSSISGARTVPGARRPTPWPAPRAYRLGQQAS